jgi:hypothetical protein
VRCPHWAGRYWLSSQEAGADTDAHSAQQAGACPSGHGRLIRIGKSNERVHPDEFGVEQWIGGYDPEELLLVPMWAVVTARALIGRFTEHCRAGTAINLADETECGVWALAATAAEPLPGTPVPDTRHELAELMARVYDALRAALPGP